MELCEILGFCSNAVKDSIVLGYAAASVGHWCVVFLRQYSGPIFNSQVSTGHCIHAIQHCYNTSATTFNTCLMQRTWFKSSNTMTLQPPGTLVCSQGGVLTLHKNIAVPVHAMKAHGEMEL
jgi:hypothetical protein